MIAPAFRVHRWPLSRHSSLATVVCALGVAAAVLVGSLVPTTFAGHDFWNVEDPAARTAQRTQFLKNLTMIGGLLFAVLDKPRSRA